MLLSMRRKAPVLVAVALAGVSLVAAAQVVISNVPAPKAVTFDEVRVFVYTTLAMVLLAVCGSAAGLVAFVLNRDRAAAAAAVAAATAAVVADHEVRKEQFAVIGKAVESVGESVRALADAMKEHEKSPFPHPAAVHANQKAMDERMTKMAADFGEHVTFCLTHQCAFGERDPRESPYPRRETDPPGYSASTAHEDGGPVRGRARS